MEDIIFSDSHTHHLIIDHLRNDVMQHTRTPQLFLDQTLCEHSGGLIEKAAKKALRLRKWPIWFHL